MWACNIPLSVICELVVYEKRRIVIPWMVAVDTIASCVMYDEAMTHLAAVVGLSFEKQLSHTLTSFSIPNFGIRELLDEHLLQNICPQARQWCYNYTHINKYSLSTTYAINMINAFPEQSIIYKLFISVQCHVTSYHGNMKCELLLVSLQRGDILCISSQLVDADATSSVNQDFY